MNPGGLGAAKPHRRSVALLAGMGLLAAVIYGVGFDAAPDVSPTTLYAFISAPLVVLWLAASGWVWRRPGIDIRWVMAFALAFRLLASIGPPELSSDIHRYAWDGRVQRAGISPYAHPPGDPALAHLRDAEIWPRINRKASRTVYPPAAQALFAWLPYDIRLLRLLMIAFDMLTILLIARLLRTTGRDPARSILFAWSPLVVYEVANNGHLEAALLPLLLLAVLAVRAGRHRRAGLLMGLAVAMKLYPALALVALARRRPLTVLAGAGAVVVGLYIIYGSVAGVHVIGFLPDYVGSAEDFNIGLRRAIENVLGVVASADLARSTSFLVCLVLLGLGAALIARSQVGLERKMLHLTGLYLLTLPTAFHPWYALWFVPWLCFHPGVGGVWLLATLPLSYLKYDAPGEVMPAWIPVLEFLPASLLLGWQALRHRSDPHPPRPLDLESTLHPNRAATR